MKIWVYLLICIAASVYSAIEIGTTKGAVCIIASAALYSVAGFYIGHKVGHLQTTELMKKRIGQVERALPKTSFSKRLHNQLRNKRHGG